MAVGTTATDGVTYRTAWPSLSWGDSLLDFWDDFSEDGRLEERTATDEDAPTASLAVTLDLPAGSSQEITFLLTWHFPNRMTWTPALTNQADGCGCADGSCGDPADNPDWIGNHYATQYRDAWMSPSALLWPCPVWRRTLWRSCAPSAAATCRTW